MRNVLRVALVSLAALIATGCQPRTSAPAPLATVAPQPPPAAEPFVATYAPRDESEPLAQIRIIFHNDLIPLQRLETADEAAILQKFSIEPALPGHFRFLTPRMVGFQADAAIPLATRVRVTVAHGLRDLKGDTLANDFAWTFFTFRVKIEHLPQQVEPGADAPGDPPPGPLQPTITFDSNAALDLASLVAHASLVGANGETVGLVPPANAASPSPSPAAAAEFDPEARSNVYRLTPAKPLAKGTTYDVVITPGVQPAGGNLASDTRFAGKIRTYGVFSFAGVSNDPQADGRFHSGTPQIHFNNPVDDKTLAALHLSPAPRAGQLFAAFGSSVSINATLLDPNTDYRVTIGPAIADTFGQQLGHEETGTFTTGDRSSSLWAPSGAFVFPRTADVKLNMSVVNLKPPQLRARFLTLAPADIVHNDDPSGENAPVLGDSGNWPVFPLNIQRNDDATIPIPLTQRLPQGGVLAYGLHETLGATGDSTPPVQSTISGLVQLTNLGTFAQWFPDSGFVQVHHLSDGTPASGARVDVFHSQTTEKTKTDVQPCATALTGADGVAAFRGATFAACAALDGGKNSAPSLVTTVHEGGDWTYVRTDDASGRYGTDLYTGWSSATPISRATIFSDRSLYQPGETVTLSAVGWFYTHGTLARGTAPRYSVELQLPNDQKRTLAPMTLDAYGMASFTIPITHTMPLGYYTVHASAGNGEELFGTFRVAEFKPPNFKVGLVLAADTATAGTPVSATTTSTYLFGSPAQGATTTYDVTRSLANFTWDTDPAYSFGRQWFWPEQTPDVSSDVTHQVVPVDARGAATATIPVAADLPYPMTYRIDAETTDVSNLSVADSKTFTAYPSNVQIGVKTPYVANAGDAIPIQIVVLDAHGKPAAATGVHLELQSMTYHDATAVVEGGDQPEPSVTYATTASTDVTSDAKPVTATLRATAGGTYRIRARVAGATTDASETDVQLYVAGSGEFSDSGQQPDRLNVHLDKTKYAPGDTAQAVVAAPFPDNDLLVSVVRSGVMWQKRLRVHAGATTVAIPIGHAMLPNAAVEAVAVRRGPLPRGDTSLGNAVARSGFASFDVKIDERGLKIALRPLHSTLAPASPQRVHLHLTGFDGAPVRGQVTLVVVNDAILQLSGSRFPDLLQLVYADQPISTVFADNRSAIVLHTLTRPIDKGWGFGGGLSGGAEDTRIRHNFQPLAYSTGALRTDANGDADVSFTLPDDLTTWRVMAAAATTDGRFGNGEATFISTKRLIANPVVPQFARPGDSFDAGAAISNPLGLTGATLDISAALTPPLAFTLAGATATTASHGSLAATTTADRFPMKANAVGTSRITITATAHSGSATYHDGFAIPFDVTDQAVMESVIQTGVSTTTARLPLTIAPDTPRDAGGVQLELANSLIPDALVAADAAFRDTSRLPLLAAGRITVASDLLRLLAQTGSSGSATSGALAHAKADLTAIRPLQRADGGFASYDGATVSDPFDSLTVLTAYTRAAAAGIAVDSASRTQLMAYAAKVLNEPQSTTWCGSDPCKSIVRLHALVALADAGDVRTTYLSDIYVKRAPFGLGDRFLLARYLLRFPDFRKRGLDEARQALDSTYQTGALATINSVGHFGWFNDRVVAQALATQLAIDTGDDETTIDRFTRGLLAARRNGTWGCTCQNAAALDALVAVAKHQGAPAAFTVAARVGAVTLPEATFTNKATLIGQQLPAARLASGNAPIVLDKSGSGVLHYAVTYRYRLAGPQAGRYEGMRVTRTVRAAGAPAILATMGLSLPPPSISFDLARVYDVEVQVITDHAVDRVEITDPLPAGFEAVDTSFATTSQAHAPQYDAWKLDEQQIYHDHIEAYIDRLDAGAYSMHYLVRSVTPGDFAWPGAEARLATQPQEFGRAAATRITIH